MWRLKSSALNGSMNRLHNGWSRRNHRLLSLFVMAFAAKELEVGGIWAGTLNVVDIGSGRATFAAQTTIPLLDFLTELRRKFTLGFGISAPSDEGKLDP